MIQTSRGMGISNLRLATSVVFLGLGALLVPPKIKAQVTSVQSTSATDNPNARPVTQKSDLEIVKRAKQILDSPSKWNRADNRECPAGAKTFSLYCALQIATNELTGKSEHRGAALQEARFVIDELTKKKNYEHRLMGYNNDPTTTFSDIQEVLRIVETRLTTRLKADAPKTEVTTVPSAEPTVAKTDIEILKRARQILDSPSKWSRSRNQECPTEAKTFNLYCTLVKAATEVKGEFDDTSASIREVRHVIDEIAPNRKDYRARLIDYNEDPTTTFEDIRKLLQFVEERLIKRFTENATKQ